MIILLHQLIALKLRSKQQIDKYLGGLLVTLNLAAARLLGFVLRRNHSLEKKPAHILFIKLMGIGSVWMAADAIAAVKQKYPDARLVLIGTPAVINGVKPLALFDEYLAFKDHSFAAIAGSSMSTLLRCWQMKKLWVANLEVYSRLASVFALWTMGINRFDFYFNEVAFRKNINTHPVYFNAHVLVTDNYNRMAAAMGAPVTGTYEIPQWKASARKESIAGKQFILVNNTCSELARERMLPEKSWLTLLQALCQHYPQYQLLLAGSPAETVYNHTITEQLQQAGLSNRIENRTAAWTFPEYLDVLYKQVAMVITIDSGPLHFANRLGVPVVSCWGPTHPDTRIMQTKQNRTVYLAVSCSPCTHHTAVLPCGGDNFCMKRIAVSTILQKVHEILPPSA
jgi:ADP-heptose:LPS heptosyltransferase